MGKIFCQEMISSLGGGSGGSIDREVNGGGDDTANVATVVVANSAAK